MWTMTEQSPNNNDFFSPGMRLVNRYIQDLEPGSLRWDGVNLASCLEYDEQTPLEEFRTRQHDFIRHVFTWAGISSDPFEALPDNSRQISWRLKFGNGTDAKLIKRENAGSPGDFEFILL